MFVCVCMWCLSTDFHFRFVIRASTDAMLQYKLRALYGVEGRTHHDQPLLGKKAEQLTMTGPYWGEGRTTLTGEKAEQLIMTSPYQGEGRTTHHDWSLVRTRREGGCWKSRSHGNHLTSLHRLCGTLEVLAGCTVQTCLGHIYIYSAGLHWRRGSNLKIHDT